MHDWYDYLTLGVAAVSGLGTLIAILVAIAYGKKQVAQFTTQQEQRDEDQRERDEERRQEQARCVTAEVLRSGPPQARKASGPHVGQLQASDLWEWQYMAEVHNGSPWPIYDAAIQLHGDTRLYMVGFVAGNQKQHAHMGAVKGLPRSLPAPHLYFRDAGNRWWFRDDDGYLSELDECPYEKRVPESEVPGRDVDVAD